MEEWKECKIGDVLNFRRGHDLPKTVMKGGNIPVAGSNGIIGFHNEATPVSPCITIGRSGNVGTPYIYDKCWAHNTVLYIDDFKGNNPLYLFYLLKTLPLSSFGGGSAVPTLNRNHIHPLIIKHTSNYKTQQNIASILKTLDDKIYSNRRINDNLEQQAQVLFKSWFVDFEPFMEEEFVESELGMIPKGWRVGTLGEICSQSSLKVGSRDDVKVLSPVTTGNLMLSEEYFTKQVFSESIAKYKVVNKGAFAYNPARVNIGSLGRNEYEFDGCVSPVYVVFECKEGYANYFDLFRATERFKSEVLLRAIGGVRQSLNYVDFAMIQTIIAPQDVVDAFNPMYEKIKTMQKHLEIENDRLATLRDTLLPKLMSGELKINDINA